MSLISEFKEFIRRGNVVDLAVGVIMGAAFGKIVNSLVSDILMPPIGYAIGGMKFTELKIPLPKNVFDPLKLGEVPAEPATINIGSFIQASIDFFIIAFCVFILIKGMNTFMKKEKAAPEPTPTEKLLVEIRDLLKAQ